MFRCTPLISSLVLATVLLGSGCSGEEEGGFVQIDPPDPSLNEDDGLPFESDEDLLYASLNADEYYNVLCVGNQGFGDFYRFEQWQCSNGQVVATIRWNPADGEGELSGTDALFTVASSSHGTVDGNAVVGLPLDTVITVEGVGDPNADVGVIEWTYTLDGDGRPVVVDLYVDRFVDSFTDGAVN